MPEATAYEQRHLYQAVWYETGCRLRSQMPGILVEKSLENGKIIAGIRDLEEVEYVCRGQKVGHILWIDRPWLVDTTLKFTKHDCFRLCEQYGWRTQFHIIPNHLSLIKLHSQLKKWCKANNYPILTSEKPTKNQDARKRQQLDISGFRSRLSKTD